MIIAKDTALNQYIKSVPEEAQKTFLQLYKMIADLLPTAEQVISYGILTFKHQGKPVVYCAGFKKHVSMYPAPTGHSDFAEDFKGYKTGKGTVQFPLDKPLPVKLVTKIVKHRLQETQEKLEQKRTLRTCSNGHKFYKTSDCPTCPICEAQQKPADGFLSLLGAPARRALVNNGITTLSQLAAHSEKEILAFHGMGKASLPVLRQALSKEGLGFKM